MRAREAREGFGPKKISVHELSKELGLTSKELLTLAQKLGIGASSPSASIEDAQADRIRRRADADGLRREVPARGGKRRESGQGHEGHQGARRTRRGRPPRARSLAARTPARAVAVSQRRDANRAPRRAPAPAPAAGRAKVVRSRAPCRRSPRRRVAPRLTVRRRFVPPSVGGGASGEGGSPSTVRRSVRRGRPIPPPPGRPMSSTGRPIPPPPGARRPMPGGASRVTPVRAVRDR